MKLGEVIRSIRKKKGIKQDKLAKECVITQAYLSQIENDKKEPNLATLKVISKGLGVPLPVIFFLSLSSDDVPEEKQEHFLYANPMLRQVVDSIFFSEQLK